MAGPSVASQPQMKVSLGTPEVGSAMLEKKCKMSAPPRGEAGQYAHKRYTAGDMVSKYCDAGKDYSSVTTEAGPLYTPPREICHDACALHNNSNNRHDAQSMSSKTGITTK